MRWWGKKRKGKVAPAGLEPTWYQALTMEPQGHTASSLLMNASASHHWAIEHVLSELLFGVDRKLLPSCQGRSHTQWIGPKNPWSSRPSFFLQDCLVGLSLVPRLSGSLVVFPESLGTRLSSHAITQKSSWCGWKISATIQ